MVTSPRVAHPIHPSLYRPVLFAGVEQPVAIVEATAIVALLVGVGLHLSTIALAIIVVVAVHPMMIWLTAQDSEITRMYVQSARLTDYYAPVAAVHSTPRAVRPSVPSIR